MLIGLAFALLVIACGVAVQRRLRLPLSLAPLSGLAAIAVLTSWTTTLHLPPLVGSAAVGALALGGVAGLIRQRWSLWARTRRARVPALLLLAGALLPALLLGSAFADLQAPLSVHDGAYHVEAIDALRRGASIQGWYPMGFHTSLVALLAPMPWLDSARGTAEAAQGLAVLAPLALFGLTLALGVDALIAAIAAALLGLTWIYPYDYHVWGGWPQGMGVLLLIGLWAAGLHWIARPSLRLAMLCALFAAAIVLSHGTEVYSAAIGFLVLVIARARWIDARRLAWHLPVALALAAVLIGPYLVTLLGWFQAGAASSAGAALADYASANPEEMGNSDWLQFALGVTGANSLVDLPVRLALIGLSLQLRQLRLATGLWLAFVGLLVLTDFFDLSPMRSAFALTYPWLVDHRPRQVAVVFGSLLSAGGLVVGIGFLRRLRPQVAVRSNTWRRWAIAGALLAGFVAEGNAISIYKRLSQSSDEQNVMSADDGRAMSWLRAHVQPQEMLANDGTRDAAIWAPYKADVAILLPRSGTRDSAERAAILQHITDLASAPAERAKSCALHLDYLYYGAWRPAYDPTLFPDKAALEAAPDLQQVFSSGEASIFRINVPCP